MKDPQRQKENQAIWYQRNKQKRLDRMYTRKLEHKIKAYAYLGNCCSLCGYDRCYAAIDFHHIDRATKEYEVSYLWGFSWEKIKSEIDKCILLCANCHREVENGCIHL